MVVAISAKQVPVTNLKRITSYVSPESYQVLEAWAKQDGRSVSNLVSRIVDKAVKDVQHEQVSDRT
jgi:hypothetical protein